MKLLPDFFFDKITDIPVSFFGKHGIVGAVLDIDNTLTGDHVPDVGDDVRAWLADVQAAGVRLMVVSNNKPPRVKALCAQIDLPFVCRAKKPSQKCVSKILKDFGAKPREIAVVGDQLFTDIWFAKRAGMQSVLVAPVGEDILFGVKLKRLLEKPLLRRYRKRGLLDSGGIK